MHRLALAACVALLAVPGSGEDYLDDAEIMTAFETGLDTLFKKGGVPTASTMLRQLRRKAHTDTTLPSPTTPPADPIAAARSATLVVGHLYYCAECKQNHSSIASGVLVSPDGLALTNYHVLDVNGAIVFGAMTLDGRLFAIEEVLASAKKDDLALVRLRDAADMPFVSLTPTPASGTELFVVSHPDAFFYSLTRGYLSRKYLDEDKAPRLQITADFAKGSSGSGVFDLQGRLFGLSASTTSIYYEDKHEEFDDLQMVVKSAVPSESIRKLFGKEGGE